MFTNQQPSFFLGTLNQQAHAEKRARARAPLLFLKLRTVLLFSFAQLA